MKCYTVVQVAQVFDPVWGPAHHRALAFSCSAFLSAFFLNLNTYVILHCQFSQFILHLPQPICVSSVRLRLVPNITLKKSSLLCIWYHTFSLLLLLLLLYYYYYCYYFVSFITAIVVDSWLCFLCQAFISA